MIQYEHTPVVEHEDSIFDAPPRDPISIVRAWHRIAVDIGVIGPASLALATANTDGRASNRVVHMLEIKPDGVVFATHAQSQKGQEIAATGWASGVLYWREINRQIVLSGPIAPISDPESDALWAKRPVETNAMSYVSHQSATLENEEALRKRAQMLIRSSTPLARPDGWCGYALRPEIVEFWQLATDRLHGRLRYEATSHGWTHRRLQP